MKRQRADPKHVSARQIDAAGSLVAGAFGTKTEQQQAADIAAAAKRAANRPASNPWRVKHVTEAVEQEKLAAKALSRWWGPGFRSHEQARVGRRSGESARRRGQRPGWPDVTVHICRPAYGQEWGRFVLAALELKSERERPKRGQDQQAEWWRTWIRETGWRPDSTGDDPTRYGLRASQAWTLWQLGCCGYRTMVAYGADEAIEWLDDVCGERPAVMPEGWSKP